MLQSIFHNWSGQVVFNIFNMGWKKHNLKDDTVMWFGIHKGKRLKDIPDSYFQYLLDNNLSFRGIKNYSKKRLK